MVEWKNEVLFVSMFLTNVLVFMAFTLLAPLFPAEATSKGVSYTIQVGPPPPPPPAPPPPPPGHPARTKFIINQNHM